MEINNSFNTRPLPVDIDIMWAAQNTVKTMWMNQFGTIPSVLEKVINLPTLNTESFNKSCKSVEEALNEAGFEYTVSNLAMYPKTRVKEEIENGTFTDTDDDPPYESDIRLARVYTVDALSYKHPTIKDYVVVSMTGSKLTMVYEEGDNFDFNAREAVFNAFVSNESFEALTKNIMMIEQYDGDFILSRMQVNNPEDFSYDRLYNDDFKKVGEHIEEFITNKKSGLVLLHGTHGTGKTTYLRYLISKHNRKFVYMPVEVASMMSSPSFISFVNENLKDAVIILEDCENLLRERSSSGTLDSSIINILNMSDGLLGDSMCMKFICTFNSPFSLIDKALTRKGRLFERYEFKALSEDKTAKLVKELYDKDYTGEGMTLSEVFNMDVDNHGTDNNTISIGY